jgi:hypothetical protein
MTKLYWDAFCFGLKVLVCIAIIMVISIPACLAYVLDQIFDEIYRRLGEWIDES